MKISNSCWILLLAWGCTGKTVLVEGADAAGAAGWTFNTLGEAGRSGVLVSNGGSYGPAGGALGTDATPAAGAGVCADTSLPVDATRPGYTAPRDPSVATLLSWMSPDAKIKQMYGVPNPTNRDLAAFNDLMRSQDVALGNGKVLRGFRYRNGARGVTLAEGQDNRASQGKDYSTAFPAPSVRAASWDVELEMRIGESIGDETIASLNNVLIAPSATILRHPYWGRSQESYGEDMHHLGRMASAFIAGAQRHVPACVAHFVANNIENNRANVNAVMDEQTLREVYGRPFEMVVREGGVACVMAAYNSVNGVKSTQNRHLLTEILRSSVENGGMGFRGFVISDWWAMPGGQDPRDTASAQAVASGAVKAGLDVEVPWVMNFSQLEPLVSDGTLAQSAIDTSAGRILEQKVRFNSTYSDGPWGLGTVKTKLSGDSITTNEEHLALAEEAELKSAVLLANGTSGAPVLPIRNATSIAVVGLDVTVMVSPQTTLPVTGDRLKFASDVNLGDRGGNRVNADPATSIGPFEGIKLTAARHNTTNVTTGTSVV
ncbi:MAG TPA: glycoside hydrolase family 3 N-terminal domain-containing protein, partial [Polyangiaceae bacterium]